MRNFLLLVSMTMVLLYSCQFKPQGVEKNIYVGAQLVDCQGVGPMKCLQVKDAPEEEWRLFYGVIEGFTYEEGFIYTLKIRETQVENPPADGSSLKWTLVEVMTQEEMPAPKDQGKTWTLQAYGPPAELTPVPADITVTLIMDLIENKVFGTSGCNRYTGILFTGEGGVRIGEISSTEMACAEVVMAVETAYLGLLPAVRAYKVESGQLIMDCDDGQQLVFSGTDN